MAGRMADAITPRPQLRAAYAGGPGVGRWLGGPSRVVENHYHIGTLIANDKGIDELDDRIERRRRHRRRGAGRHTNEPN